jgi:hypothetical protein
MTILKIKWKSSNTAKEQSNLLKVTYQNLQTLLNNSQMYSTQALTNS